MKRLTILTILFALLCTNAFSQGKQFLYIEFTPTDATLEINGEIQQTEDGTFQKLLPFGVYEYKIYKKGFLAIDDNIVIDDISQTYRLQHNLKEHVAEVSLITENDADIYINGELCGSGSWTGKLNIGEEYIFESKKENHTTGIFKKIITQGDEYKTFTIPNPTPICGSLIVSCSPAKANLYVDDKLIGPTPQYIHQLIIGEHNIRIEFDQYYSTGEKITYTETLDIKENEEREVYVSMKHCGALSIESTSPIHKVRIDGKYIENTSGKYILPTGEHEFKVEFDKYYSTGEKIAYKQTIDIKENEKTEVFVSMEKLYGALSIESTSPIHIVCIDGKYIENTSGKYILPTGEHEFKVEFDKYYSTGEKIAYKQTIDIKENEETEVFVSMEELYGTLIIKSTASNPGIYANKKYLGNRSGKYILPTGEHEIAIIDNGQIKRQTINIEAGENHSFVLDFDKTSQIDHTEEEAIPFQLVEEKPSFQGGDANQFSKWVNQRLVYPEIAKENGVQGKVTLQFTVAKDGSVTNVTILRSVDPSLDKEAVRVVSSSPRWFPGFQRDRAVPVTYTFPVMFQLR